MPKKARHGSGRYGTSRKAKRLQREAAGIVAQPQAPAAPIPAAPAPAKPRAEQRPATPVPAMGVGHYGYVRKDLRNIGILVGVMAVILVVLSFVLR